MVEDLSSLYISVVVSTARNGCLYSPRSGKTMQFWHHDSTVKQRFRCMTSNVRTSSTDHNLLALYDSFWKLYPYKLPVINVTRSLRNICGVVVDRVCDGKISCERWLWWSTIPARTISTCHEWFPDSEQFPAHTTENARRAFEWQLRWIRSIQKRRLQGPQGTLLFAEVCLISYPGSLWHIGDYLSVSVCGLVRGPACLHGQMDWRTRRPESRGLRSSKLCVMWKMPDVGVR